MGYWKNRPPETKKKIGRPRKITPAMGEELFEFILTDCSTRFMSLFEIPYVLGWDVSELHS
jgi:hypothetical protein